MTFDPDAFLAEPAPAKSFDPDAFLSGAPDKPNLADVKIRSWSEVSPPVGNPKPLTETPQSTAVAGTAAFDPDPDAFLADRPEVKPFPETTIAGTTEKPLKDFEKRMQDPNAFITNPDGTISTHKMAWGQAGGKFIAFPTIVPVDGELKQLGVNDAADFAIKNNEYKSFDTAKDAETYAAGSWKEGTPFAKSPQPQEIFPANAPVETVKAEPLPSPEEIQTKTPLEIGTKFLKNTLYAGIAGAGAAVPVIASAFSWPVRMVNGVQAVVDNLPGSISTWQNLKETAGAGFEGTDAARMKGFDVNDFDWAAQRLGEMIQNPKDADEKFIQLGMNTVVNRVAEAYIALQTAGLAYNVGKAVVTPLLGKATETLDKILTVKFSPEDMAAVKRSIQTLGTKDGEANFQGLNEKQRTLFNAIQQDAQKRDILTSGRMTRGQYKQYKPGEPVVPAKPGVSGAISGEVANPPAAAPAETPPPAAAPGKTGEEIYRSLVPEIPGEPVKASTGPDVSQLGTDAAIKAEPPLEPPSNDSKTGLNEPAAIAKPAENAALANPDVPPQAFQRGVTYKTGNVETLGEDMDHMTGVPGKNISVARVNAAAKGNQKLVLYFDIDNFKAVNETYGHDEGNNVLAALGGALQDYFGHGEMGRVGGEEFYAAIDNSPENVQMAHEFLKAVPELVTVHDHPVTISGGLGTGVIPTQKGGERLYADKLLNMAKEAGKNQIVFDNHGKIEYLKGKEGLAKPYVDQYDLRSLEETAGRVLARPDLSGPQRTALEGAVQAVREKRSGQIPGQGGQRANLSAPGGVASETVQPASADKVVPARKPPEAPPKQTVLAQPKPPATPAPASAIPAPVVPQDLSRLSKEELLALNKQVDQHVSKAPDSAPAVAKSGKRIVSALETLGYDQRGKLLPVERAVSKAAAAEYHRQAVTWREKARQMYRVFGADPASVLVYNHGLIENVPASQRTAFVKKVFNVSKDETMDKDFSIPSRLGVDKIAQDEGVDSEKMVNDAVSFYETERKAPPSRAGVARKMVEEQKQEEAYNKYLEEKQAQRETPVSFSRWQEENGLTNGQDKGRLEGGGDPNAASKPERVEPAGKGVGETIPRTPGQSPGSDKLGLVLDHRGLQEPGAQEALQTFEDALSVELRGPVPANQTQIVSPSGVNEEPIRALQEVFPHWSIHVVRVSEPLIKRVPFDGVAIKGQIFLNESSKDPTFWVVAHEVGHVIKSKHPGLYAKAKADFLSNLSDDGRMEIKRRAVAESVGKRSVKMTDAQINGEFDKLSPFRKEIGEDEIFCDSLADSFMDKGFLHTLRSRSPEFFKKLISAFIETYSRIIRAFRGKFKGRTQPEWFKSVVAMRDRMARLIRDIYVSEHQQASESASRKIIDAFIDAVNKDMKDKGVVPSHEGGPAEGALKPGEAQFARNPNQVDIFDKTLPGDLFQAKESAGKSRPVTEKLAVPPAPPVPSVRAERVTREPAQPSGITDFGAKIGGAKKDLWKQRGLQASDMTSMTQQEKESYATKANVWPAADYEKMVADGMRPEIAYLVKKAKDAISLKPEIPRNVPVEERPAKLERYVTVVSRLKGYLERVRSLEDIRGVQREVFPSEGYHYTKQANDDVLLLGGRALSKALQAGPYEMVRAERFIKETGFPAKQEAWEKRFDIRESPAGMTIYDKGQERTLTEGEYFVTKKGSRSILSDGFKTREEAVAWAREKATVERGEQINRPFRENITRTGENYRKGANIEGKDLMSQFGFRGGEFGNWTNAGDRQQSLNEAYDGLKDMADVLGIPDKAVSLNGELGIAFGARGSGKALAHYEPSRIVINLTKTGGAGSLAHEWAHAMDDYFGRMASGGLPGQYLSGSGKIGKVRPEMVEAYKNVMRTIAEKAATKDETIAHAKTRSVQYGKYLNSWLEPILEKGTPDEYTNDVISMLRDEKPKMLSGVRVTAEELSTALKNHLKDKFNYRAEPERFKQIGWNADAVERANVQMAKAEAGEFLLSNQPTKLMRGSLLTDKGKAKAYWSTPHELFARAFESYVEDRLKDQGQQSDYLVHSTDVGETEGWGSVYPHGEERVAIGKAFDKFFETLQSKETDKGVAMFSRSQEPAPTFYSALARSIENAPAKLDNLTGAQWKGWLDSNAPKLGVKADEIEWSGIKDYLALKGKEKITKADVSNYLAQNGVKVQEVEKGHVLKQWTKEGNALVSDDGYRITPFGEKSAQLIFPDKSDGVYSSMDEAKEVAERTPTGPKFEKYQLPGGENYRELLLTLPTKETRIPNTVYRKSQPTKEKLIQHIDFDPMIVDRKGNLKKGLYYGQDKKGGWNVFEDTIVRNERFQAGHFEESNVLAHIRFNDRTDAEGKRVLFLEELQSDWAQKARREGFVKPRPTLERLEEIKSRLIEIQKIAKPAAHRDSGEYHALDVEERMLQDEFNGRGGVPAAPFVGDTKAWVGLALKRMIRYAAENGYDKVAWTTGAQQVDRYDLSKQIGSIMWAKLADGDYGISAFGLRGADIPGLRNKRVAKNELADTIGKDLADKIINSPDNKGDFKGIDLKVGGEGMNAFYDNIVPQVANDILKKVGGGKVSDTPLAFENANFDQGDTEDGGMPPEETVQTKGFEITPEMREKVMSEGLPMFSRSLDDAVEQTITAKDKVPATDDNVTIPKSVNAEAERRMKEAKGIQLTPFYQKIGPAITRMAQAFTRHYPNLGPEDARVGDILRQFEAVPEYAEAISINVVHQIVGNLGPQKYRLLTQSFILPDLLKDIDRGLFEGKDQLPFGYKDRSEVQTDFDNTMKAVAENPDVSDAMRRRQEFNLALRNDLVKHKLLPDSILEDDAYYHHQVLEKIAEKELFGRKTSGGGDAKLRAAGFMRERMGSALDYNTEYVEAEGEVISQAIEKLETLRKLRELQPLVDISETLAAEAAKEHRSMQIPEGYTGWSPKQNTPFYAGKTIPEKVIEQLVNRQLDQAVTENDIREILAAGKAPQWVVKDGVARTLDEIKAPSSGNVLDKGAQIIQSKWKQWVLINPVRILKYNINNMSGDADITMAYHPAIFKGFPQAAADMWRFLVKKEAPTPEILHMIKKGIIGSGWSTQEVPDISKLAFFRAVTGKEGGKLKRFTVGAVGKYWDTSKNLTEWRESILRVAAYRWFKQQMDAGNKLYGVSKADEINAIPDGDDRAAKLSRELLGDYGNISEAGAWMRTRAYPFWSWVEINAPRYLRLLKNARLEGNSEAAAAGKVAGILAGKLTKKAAFKIAKVAIAANVLFVMINLWNHVFHKKEEEELGSQGTNQMHLILGRNKQGQIITLRLQGALSDVLNWVDLHDFPQDIWELVNHKKTAKDMAKEAGISFLSKLYGGIGPQYKTPVELITKSKAYPSIDKLSPIRDRMEYLMSVLSLDKPYRMLSGTPSRGNLDEAANVALYTTDPGEAAYYDIKDAARKFLEKKSDYEVPAVSPSDKSNVLYFYKKAVKYGDTKAARKYWDEYKAQGGTYQTMNQSVKNMNPLSAFSGHNFKYRAEFVKQLTPRERDGLTRASAWFTKLKGETREATKP